MDGSGFASQTSCWPFPITLDALSSALFLLMATNQCPLRLTRICRSFREAYGKIAEAENWLLKFVGNPETFNLP